MKKRKSNMARKGPRTIRGKKVIDANQSLAFTPTVGDCNKGKQGDPTACVAALAIKRLVPNAQAVWVNKRVTIVEFPDRCIRYKTPTPLRDQTLIYDHKHEFERKQYTLLPVSKSMVKWRGYRTGKDVETVRRDRKLPNKRKTVNLGRPDFHYTKDVGA